MPTWMSALANGILFTIPIWLGHFYESLPWLYWVGVGIAGILIICITAANQVKLDKSFRHILDGLSRMETQQREGITQRLWEYYERIVKGVGEAEIVDPLSAMATRGLFPSSGPVRDIIQEPESGEANDDVRPN